MRHTRYSPPVAIDPVIDPLLRTDDIRRRVTDLAREIRRDVPGRLHLVAVLKGAFMFAADLARELGDPLSLDFLAVSSYGQGASTSGEVKLLKDLDLTLEGRDVLIVEDIVDTGLTLSYLRDLLNARRPNTLRTAALLSKPSRRRVEVRIDYVGFEIPDAFVVGYGLDWNERHRELPFIGILPGARVEPDG